MRQLPAMRLSLVRMRLPLLLSLILLAAGCTTPKALTRAELIEKGKLSLIDSSMAGGAESVEPQAVCDVVAWGGWCEDSGQLPAAWTLERALMYALENNVQFRIAALETAIATGNRKLASLDMLPGLVAEAGYSKRSNILASVSEDVVTGNVSLAASTSSDQESNNAQLYFGWSSLDFGLAFLRSREFGEQALMAEENRRRVMQATVRDVAYAWWQAEAYQQMQPELERMRADITEALSQSEDIVRQRLGNAMQAVEYRSALLLVLRRLDSLSLRLDQSRDELARLLHLPPGLEVHVAAAVGDDFNPPALPDIDLRYWQSAAMLNRPEVRQAHYESRATNIAAHRRLLELFPRLLLNFGTHRDSNSYLVNDRWQQGSAQLSWNMMKLASVPGMRRDARMNRELARLREEAQAAAVLSQVAIAGKAYERNRHGWCLSKALLTLNERKSELLDARSAAASMDRLTLTRAQLETLLLRTESALQFAEYQHARLTMLLSAGLLDLPVTDGPAMAQTALHHWLRSGTDADMLAELRQTGTDFGLPELPDDAVLRESAAKACFQ